MKRFSWSLLAYAAFVFVPIYWLISMGFKQNAEIAGALTLYPNAPHLANFARIFSDAAWYMGYFHAAVYVALNVTISVAVALPAAYAFSRFQFPGKRKLLFSLLLFRMMAPAILIVPFVEVFSRANLIDTYWAVALAHCFFNVPLAVWILEGFMSAVPKELDESAMIDGHSTLSFFHRILLPQIAPGIAVAAFFCFLYSSIEFMLANALTVVKVKPIASIMTRAGGVLFGDYALLAAASTLAVIPGAALIWLVRKHLVRGFSMGRVA
jgi:glycerol transport system permease protein